MESRRIGPEHLPDADLFRPTLVLGACLVAWPLMRNWLAGFPYRLTMGWGVFAVSGLLAFAAALLIVSAHTLRASRANPVEAIRNE